MGNLKSFNDFCEEEPCLEEMAGFRSQRMKDGRWSNEDQVAYLIKADRLNRGIDIPATSKLQRTHDYVRRKKPKLNAYGQMMRSKKTS